MKTKLITDDPWRQITGAAKHSAGRVAVAFFGKGAAKQLPLKKGSVLVVDASEGRVKAGQTCPADLIALIKKGVKVFSVDNLHAKVFAFRRVGFVGSTNVSQTSANGLVEAVLRTSERSTLGEIREFVESLAREPVGIEHAKRLADLYKPPKFGRGGGARGSRRRRVSAVHAALRVLILHQEEWDDDVEAAADKNRPAAKKALERGSALDELEWGGTCPFDVGDEVLQVTTCWDNVVRVSPPGRVIKIVKVPGRASTRVTFVEVPKKNRRSMRRMRSLAGRKVAKRLQHGGALAPAFARAVRDVFYG